MDINANREVRIYNISHPEVSEGYWRVHLDPLYHNVWTIPEKVLQEFGSLEYQGDCENHYLAFNRVAEFLDQKRERFIHGPAQRWGDKPVIQEEEEGETRRSIAETFHNPDFIYANFFPRVKEDILALHDLSLVCKAFTVAARAVSGDQVMFYNHLVFVRDQYYEVLLAKGPGNSIQTVRYKCCCQLWDDYIKWRKYVNWEMTAPENDNFEGYLERQDVRQVVAQLPGAPMVTLP